MPFPKNLPCETIINSIADGVFTVDLDWNITFFNDSAARITGVSPEDALGQKCWEVFHSSLCDGACAIRACLDEDTTISNKSIFIVRPDGEKVPISISAAPLTDKNGKVIGGVETFRDISAIHLLRKKMEGTYTFEDIVGKSRSINKIFQIIPQVAKSEATVLLLGESGTGKELFARAIHNLSPRKKGPFVAVNCGALPGELLESELFGYKAGAFTDAKKDKFGRFQVAEGGTIFLDEIGDVPHNLQVKLLRVLQERTFEPLGAVKSVSANVRVIAATNQDLETMAATGEFRQDLYYRLNVVRLRLPPLRERPEDIPLLTNHFIHRLNLIQGKDIQGVSDDVLAIFMRHPFPGNVRELENILEFAFILCPSGFIQVEHLSEYLQPLSAEARPGPRAGTLEEIKCRAVLKALEKNNGKKMATCRELKISKDTLRRMLGRCREMGVK
ncbi:MAG: sigma 54-interacting transcriptional regulator [Thermodesulfobacteriota bacterium]|nr:sigma 54-interacting transcriptional regulator [Thermodesulfobacteriota bacterium]